MGPRPNVVIIDADTDFAQGLRTELDARNIDSADTGEGKMGLDLTRQNLPQAIVLCVELPRMSGYTICSTLKKDPELKHIPVVITSSGATAATFDQHRRLKKSHAQAYIHKPTSVTAVADVLISLLGSDLPHESSARGSISLVEESDSQGQDSLTQNEHGLLSHNASDQDTAHSEHEEESPNTGGVSSQDVENVADLESEPESDEENESHRPPAPPPSDEDGADATDDDPTEEEELDAALSEVFEEEPSHDLAQQTTDEASESDQEEPSEPEPQELVAESALPDHDVQFSDIPQEDVLPEEDQNAEEQAAPAEEQAAPVEEQAAPVEEQAAPVEEQASKATIPVEEKTEEQTMRAQITYLASRVEQLEQEKSELHIAHGHAESARTSRISVSTRETLALKKERNAIKKQLLELQSVVAQRDAELLTWNDREMELESQIVEISDENDKLLTEKADLEDTVAGKRSEFVQAEARLDQLREEHQALVDNHHETKTQLSSLEQEAEELRSQLPGETEQEKIDELEQELTEAHTNIESLKDAVASKEEKLQQETEARKVQAGEQEQMAADLVDAQSFLKQSEREQVELRLALDEAELNKEVVENELEEVNASLGAVSEMRVKALKALQIAQALLRESSHLIGNDDYPEEYSEDINSQDLSEDLIRELSSDIKSQEESDSD